MNNRLLFRLLGIVAVLIGATMVFSLPWAHPALGYRNERIAQITQHAFEWRGFWALLASTAVSFAVGGLLIALGRGAEGKLFRKEAMAVVGLSWIIATALGALPYLFGGVERSSSVRVVEDSLQMQVYDFRGVVWQHWLDVELEPQQKSIVEILNHAGARGLSPAELQEQTQLPEPQSLLEELAQDEIWHEVLIFPGQQPHAHPDRAGNYRIRWVRMNAIDALFESQSGFSTTGATVISDLEDPVLAPHCILFWRSSTHFLGGLGIIVLFVVILGQGSAGKALMRAEIPGPTKEGGTARMQHAAWLFTATYVGLNALLALLLWLFGLKPFDALCHAFGAMATGGFSTYNASVGHFEHVPGVNAAAVEYTIVVFMVLAGTNFTLLYLLLLLRQPRKLLDDPEWRAYMLILAVAIVLVVGFGLWHRDFASPTERDSSITLAETSHAIRHGTFQVASIMTTTGFGTHDFDKWNSFARGALFLLMFVGGCAGSTAGGLKVIRHVLFMKIMRLEVEHSFHPRVVRPLRLGGKPVDDPELRRGILVYFCLILVIFVLSWMAVVTFEPDSTWGASPEQEQHKLIDSASGVAATLNNIGPGLGIVGATENYAKFSPLTKLLFVWLMMIGRLEIFAILVLFAPGFWRNR